MLQKPTQSNKKGSTKGACVFKEVEVIYTAPAFISPDEIITPAATYELLKMIYDMRKIDLKEMFYVVLLNNNNQCIGYSRINIGSTDASLVNIKEIFQLAILTNASGITISHNHPSGNLVPSDADITITKKIKEGLELFNICLVDHVIISSQGYVSLGALRKM